MKKLILAAAGLLLTTTAAAAQEVTLRLHHFMGEKAPLHGKMMVPLAAAIEEASEGRMKVEVFSGMSLGGRPVISMTRPLTARSISLPCRATPPGALTALRSLNCRS